MWQSKQSHCAHMHLQWYDQNLTVSFRLLRWLGYIGIGSCLWHFGSWGSVMTPWTLWRPQRFCYFSYIWLKTIFQYIWFLQRSNIRVSALGLCYLGWMSVNIHRYTVCAGEKKPDLEPVWYSLWQYLSTTKLQWPLSKPFLLLQSSQTGFCHLILKRIFTQTDFATVDREHMEIFWFIFRCTIWFPQKSFRTNICLESLASSNMTLYSAKELPDILFKIA